MAQSGDNAVNGQGVGLQVGAKIGKYEVVERSGMGGQAIVYKCYDRMLDRFVAAKQISPHLAEDPKFIERFRREAQIFARLGAEGTSIVAIHDLLEDPAGLFIVMEFVQGHTLETIIRDTNGPTESKAALQIIWRLAASLHMVHAAGIIHRDLKPGNIIVSEGLRPKITDFGVAASRTGQTSLLLGTTKYMAPELFSGGDADGRADLYSLGMISYELLLGRPKFNEVFAEVVRDPHSEALRWMKWHSNEQEVAPPLHKLIPAIPEGLSDIVVKMMAKKREDRFESMEMLGRAIRQSFGPRKASAGPAVGAPGAKAKAAAAAGGAMAEAEAGELDIHGPATAKIPKKPMALRTKILLAVLAFSTVLTGVVVLVVRHSQETARRENAASAIYYAGEANYKAGRFDEALDQFASIGPRFPQTSWASRAAVMVPFVKSCIDKRDANSIADWETVKDDLNAAEGEARKLLASTNDKVLVSFARDMVAQIDDRKRDDTDDRIFREAMASAKTLFDAGKYTEAIALLDTIPLSHLSEAHKAERDALKRQAGRADFDKKFAALVLSADNNAGFNEKTFADAIAKGNQQGLDAARNELRKGMDYESAKDAYQSAGKLLASSSTILLPAEVQAKDKDLTHKTDLLDKKRKWQDAQKLLNAADTSAKELDAIQNLQRIESLLGLPADSMKNSIAQARAKDLTKKAQDAFDNKKFTEARNLAMDALKAVPGYKPAQDILDRLDKGEKRQALIEKADSLFKQEKYAEALKGYTEASDIAPDQDLTDKINKSSFKLKIAEAMRLRDLGQFDEAIKILEQARPLDPSQAPLIDAMEQAMRDAKAYHEFLAQGDDLFKTGDFVKAKAAYQKAKAKNDTPEIKKKIALCDYSENMRSGKGALADKHGEEARAYGEQAKKFVKDAGVDPAEANKLIQDAEALIGAKP